MGVCTRPTVVSWKPPAFELNAVIARALGGFTRHEDHFESDRYVLSSAVGHLLEIGMPADEEVKRGKWTFAHLPAIPSRFELKPIEKNENRLKVLRAERDWTQANLADALNVSRQTINAIETGKFDPSLPLAFRAARLFGLRIEEIFHDEDRHHTTDINP